MNTLDAIRSELAAYDAARPRSLQVTTGASQAYSCRAATLLRLAGVPHSDPRLSWQALVGTAVHAVIEAATGDGVLAEQRLTYRGVPCTIDRYTPTSATVTDLKTKDSAAAIAKVRHYGPDRRHVAQVNLGAAALIEAGHPVETVELLYLPRSGDLSGAWAWHAPFDRAEADAAAEWVAEQTERAEALAFSGVPAVESLDGLRDESPRFCYGYCPWVSACRGADPFAAVSA